MRIGFFVVACDIVEICLVETLFLIMHEVQQTRITVALVFVKDIKAVSSINETEKTDIWYFIIYLEKSCFLRSTLVYIIYIVATG